MTDETRAAFSLPVRVYYEDTDAAGVVYYANYLRFLERARTEWLSALGVEIAELAPVYGIAFVVHRLDIRYVQPARLGDRVEADVKLVEAGRARLTLDQAITRGAETLVSARVELACVHSTSWRPARIPAGIVARIHDSA